jgi:hypothetical protein
MKLRQLTTILVVVLAFTVASKPAFAQKVQDCHITGNGSYHLITISINALSSHIAHGDGQPGDPIPNMSGFVFGPNCTPTLAPPPELPIGCYELVNDPSQGSPSFDVFYFGPIDILGNFTFFFGSANGTCSGTGTSGLGDGIIAASNFADAVNKCNALAGAGSSPGDLGASSGFIPSEPGFWFCTGPPQ